MAFSKPVRRIKIQVYGIADSDRIIAKLNLTEETEIYPIQDEIQLCEASINTLAREHTRLLKEKQADAKTKTD